MAVDQAQRLFDDRIRASSLEQRRAVHAEMRYDAFLRVWAQADRAGPMEPLALTRFLLERLYPELRGPRLDAIMAEFARLQAEGRWSGPVRPAEDDPEQVRPARGRDAVQASRAARSPSTR